MLQYAATDGPSDRSGIANSEPNAGPTSLIGDDDEAEFLPVTTLRQQVLDYLVGKVAEIEEQKEARRYYHAAQISESDRKVLEARGQPIVVINAIAKKVNRIVGLTERIQNNPKAFPRNPQGEAGADVATESVNYAADNNQWKTRETNCVRQCAVEGIGGVAYKIVEGDQGDADLEVTPVLGDDFFYDPTSVLMDFSDARYMGIMKWVSLDAAIELFPDQEDLLRGLMENGSELTTYADREFRFINIAQKRIRLIEHWYKHRGKWRWSFYVSSTELDRDTSPFYDEKNKTTHCFEMFRASVDQDGDTYAFFRNLKSLQDEKNQRRSKVLHLSNVRRLIMDKGAVDDVELARREWARADGVIEKNKGFDIAPDSTQFELEAHAKLLDVTNKELDDWANVDAATMTGGSVANLSGYAINLLQQPGLAEIGYFLLEYKGWKLRVYRKIWNIIQRFWQKERWIRVNGEDPENPIWLQVNGQDFDQYGRPVTVNALGQLTVNFNFDEGPDLPNTMADAYEVVKNDPNVPWQVKVQLMPISAKRKKQILAAAQQQPDPAELAAKQKTLEGMDASNAAAWAVAEKERSAAQKNRASAYQAVVEAAVDAAHFGLDAVGAAKTWAADAPVVPVMGPGSIALPPQGAAPPQPGTPMPQPQPPIAMPAPPMRAMPPARPTPPPQPAQRPSYALPF